MKESDTPLCEAYDVALLDLDGVVYVGRRAVPAAAESLAKARAAGQRPAFVTNNASRTPSAVAALLNDVGVPADAADVVTSAQAAARLLAERLPAGAPVLVVGGMGLRHALYARGLRPVSTAAERPAAVVQGFHPDLGYGLLSEGAKAVAAGALFVGSNGDLTIPGGEGPPNPGNGALLRVISSATGVEPIVTGKPGRPLHQESILRTGARNPIVVGDRLDTDIEGAHNGGADSLLVFTGVTEPLDALTAPPNRRPTYLAPDLTGLLVPHPRTVRDGDAHRCGGWTARRDGDTFTITGSGDPYDGLRALASAAWTTDEPPPRAALTDAVESLAL
ncbi:HAD superfamily hydrolase (TIGR01450 family) [Actinomadura pelletieri DSM 43383]|uniref:HAD superfamily hydrolase (TIGR01450 family) n=1 Tax=Actinomadura pelletieri DSM 43383 TaxID=1120940 RepID=A0A495QKW7_9ACTN|nr:HAD-IIA family hydrolase [Actinomadura pelletieri]RKS73237.1 HAD superfamily hydrolase (TIGR01450 family) [Actinomadura pelletieri DSM 43383]